jgi:hypothetical protein
MATTALATHGHARRRSGTAGIVGFAVACALPIVLWHDVIADIYAWSATAEREKVVLGWAPWTLMALGLVCFVPVAVEALRDREDRFYHRGSGAWVGWGVTLYLLGFALATQVAQIHALHS